MGNSQLRGLYRVEIRTTADIDLLLLAEDQTTELAKKIIRDFGLKPAIARQADLAGGPLFAIKKRNTPAYAVIGRNPDNKETIGLDFLLPNIPWFHGALERAQDNKIDFGFGKIPTMTVEDIVIAKLYALRDNQTLLKDLDDLQSIFSAQQEIDIPYLAGKMTEFKVNLPKSLTNHVSTELARISKKIERANRKRNC